MPVIPYLTFNGTCREAMTFYADVFGTRIDMLMPAGDMPDYEVPDAQKDLIAHCSIQVAGGEIYASDALMGEAEAMAGSSVMVSLPGFDTCKTAFDKLAEGGAVEMPFQETFWAKGFGMATDRFGTKWMISTEEAPDQG